MSSQSIRWPNLSVPKYATSANLPTVALDGDLAVTLDTDILYIYTGSAWSAIGGSSTVLTIGTIDSQTKSANGGVITSNSLVFQTADASFPGLISTGSQTFAGQKTFSTGLTGTLTGSASLNVLTSALGNLTDAGTDGIVVTGGTGATVGSVSLAQHVADSTHNGYLSSTDWTTFNNKQSSITTGNLTDVGTDGIVITGGTGAVVGSGTSIAQRVADATHNGYLASTDWSTFNGKQASGNYITALTGDATASGPGSVALTLATVNGNVGSFGSSTSIPSFTVNAKGLITAASGNVVIAPAGTLTGATLAAGVTASSLTSVGTVTSGTWSATTIALNKGGTGQTTKAAAFDALSPMTTGGDLIYGGASGTGTRLANGSSGQFLKSNGTTTAPSWAAVSVSAVAVQAYLSSNAAITANNPIVFDTVLHDTNSAYSNSTGLFTAPTTGYYRVSAISAVTVGGAGIYVAVAGSAGPYLSASVIISGGGGSQTVYATAAQTIGAYTDTSKTFVGSSAPYSSYLSIEFIGP